MMAFLPQKSEGEDCSLFNENKLVFAFWGLCVEAIVRQNARLLFVYSFGQCLGYLQDLY